MSLQAQLAALTVPAGTEFPGTVQELLTLISQYESITGLNPFNGINYGATEPTADDRDRPWFKTDNSGNPLGWFGWNGSAWAAIPANLPYGSTANRPSSPTEGTQYFDSTIGVAIIYRAGYGWVTLAGSPGDIKFVTGASLSAVLTINPGWTQYTDGIGRVLAGAAADGSDAETNAGADTHTNTIAEMAAHTHADLVITGSSADNGDPGNLCVTAATQNNGQQTITNSLTGSKGDGTPYDIRQKTRYNFCLVKS